MLITERYKLNIQELSEIIDLYRPLQACFDGHAGEYVFVRDYVKTCPRITEYYKPDNQNRNEKGDITVTFEGVPIRIEMKTILTGNRIQAYRNPRQITNLDGTYWRGRFKTRTSAYKTVKFPDGTELSTLCVPRTQVDVYGVCVRPFTGKWEYMFCLTSDLPPNESRNLTPVQKSVLLKSEVYVHWPPEDPWTASLETVLERAAAQKKNAPVS